MHMQHASAGEKSTLLESLIKRGNPAWISAEDRLFGTYSSFLLLYQLQVCFAALSFLILFVLPSLGASRQNSSFQLHRVVSVGIVSE